MASTIAFRLISLGLFCACGFDMAVGLHHANTESAGRSSRKFQKTFCLVGCKSPYAKVYGIHRIYSRVTTCQNLNPVSLVPTFLDYGICGPKFTNLARNLKQLQISVVTNSQLSRNCLPFRWAEGFGLNQPGNSSGTFNESSIFNFLCIPVSHSSHAISETEPTY